MKFHIRWNIPVLLLAALVGCAQTRTVTINTKPADAMIKVDGIDKGRSPQKERFTFASEKDVHRVSASRLGFKDQTVQITRDFARKVLLIELKPQTRVVYFTVAPAPGIVSVDGKPLSDEPTGAISTELEFTVDAKNNWTSHVVEATRPGFVSAKQTVTWTDLDQNYALNLEPMRKDLSVTTQPPGAQVFIDGELIGTSPVVDRARAFPPDLDTNQIAARRLRAERPGYDPVEIEVGWDEGKSEYHIDLAAKHKTVRLVTIPEDATVTIDGAEGARRAGALVYNLEFPPTNERGDLRTYKGVARKKTADSEWYPREFEIAWDGGKTDYKIELKEIMTRPMALLGASTRRDEASGWQIVPEQLTTISSKDLRDGDERMSPMPVARIEKGQSIGSFALAPDASRIVYTVLSGGDPKNFRSIMRVIRTDGSGTAGNITDGKTLDLMPSFSPGGDQILFSSNRAGRRMQIWSMSPDGAGGITRLTTADTNDIWPSIDSDPKPRLFYQAMIDTRPDPRIYMTQVGTIFQTDLTPLGGQQPRISPKNNSVLFAAPNETTGKRDIYRISDKGGGSPENLTNTPDTDEFDAVWTRDGRRIAFASDRATDSDGKHNYDVWVLDLTKPGEPMQITTNVSLDDQPVWDPDGRTLYFRSNRGGTWGIWKTVVK